MRQIRPEEPLSTHAHVIAKELQVTPAPLAPRPHGWAALRTKLHAVVKDGERLRPICQHNQKAEHGKQPMNKPVFFETLDGVPSEAGPLCARCMAKLPASLLVALSESNLEG